MREIVMCGIITFLAGSIQIGCLLGDSNDQFEVASIKPSATVTQAVGGMVGFRNGGRLAVRNITLKGLICLAYTVEEYRVTAPAWVDEARFDVTAKAGGPVKDLDARRMLQDLLAERFRLETHWTAKTQDGFELTALRANRKLRRSASSKEGGLQVVIDGQLRGAGVTMAMLCRGLQALLAAPVSDHTGLSGAYDIAVNWVSDDTAPDSLSLFTALREELGLFLRPSKVPIEVLVVDSAIRTPAEN